MDISDDESSKLSPEVRAAWKQLQLAEAAAKKKSQEKRWRRKEKKRLGGSNGVGHDERKKEHQTQEPYMKKLEGVLGGREGEQNPLGSSTQADNMEMEQVLNMEDSMDTQMDVQGVDTDRLDLPLVSSYPLIYLHTNLINHIEKHV